MVPGAPPEAYGLGSHAVSATLGESASASTRTVLVVFHQDVLGGATLSVTRMIPHLEERGWRFVFWVDRPSPLFDALQDRGLTVSGRPRPIAYSLAALRQSGGLRRHVRETPSYLRAFRKFIHQTSPSIVHANSLFTMAEALTARATGTPTVFHVHEMRPRGWKGRVGGRLAHRAGQLVAVSKASSASYARNGNSPPIVYEAAPVPEEPVRLRRTPRPFRVGTVGVISTRKGSDIFVEAARQVASTRDDVSFHMVGAPTDVLEADWAGEVLEAASSAGVSHKLQANVPEELSGWDAFVLPSRMDPFPIAMLEAMASGLPVIGARRDGIAEQITPETGILVEPDDPEDLSRAIRQLAAKSYEERAAMGSAARQRIQQNFTIEDQAEAMHQRYASVVDKRPS
jgi:glycosyltransferase involved in cell wall biosynthesis